MTEQISFKMSFKGAWSTTSSKSVLETECLPSKLSSHYWTDKFVMCINTKK